MSVQHRLRWVPTDTDSEAEITFWISDDRQLTQIEDVLTGLIRCGKKVHHEIRSETWEPAPIKSTVPTPRRWWRF